MKGIVKFSDGTTINGVLLPVQNELGEKSERDFHMSVLLSQIVYAPSATHVLTVPHKSAFAKLRRSVSLTFNGTTYTALHVYDPYAKDAAPPKIAADPDYRSQKANWLKALVRAQ